MAALEGFTVNSAPATPTAQPVSSGALSGFTVNSSSVAPSKTSTTPITPVSSPTPSPVVQSAVSSFFSKIGGALKTVGNDVVSGVEGAYNDIKTAAGTPVDDVPGYNPNVHEGQISIDGVSAPIADKTPGKALQAPLISSPYTSDQLNSRGEDLKIQSQNLSGTLTQINNKSFSPSDMEAVNNTPFTNTARDIINKANVTYGDLSPGIGGQNDKDNITLAKNQSPSVLNHELFHTFFQNSKINPSTFNSDFETAMKTDPEVAKIDQNLNASHYNRSDTYSLANERFAYMGEVMGNDGLSNIPPSLQKYYAPYLNDGNPTTQTQIDNHNAQVDKLQNDLNEYGKNIDQYNASVTAHNTAFTTEDQDLANKIVSSDPTQTGFLGVLKGAFIPTQLFNSKDSSLINNARAQMNAQYAKDHPAMSAFASTLGQLANLVLIGKVGGGLGLEGTVNEAVGPGLKNLYPTATRIAGLGAESGSIFGIANGLSETLKESGTKEFDLGKIGKETAVGAGTGLALGGAGALSSLGGRVAVGGATMGAIGTLQSLIQNGKLTTKDITPILMNTILGAGFEAFGGTNKSDLFKSQTMNDISKESTIVKIMGNHPEMTRAEATKLSSLMDELNFVAKSGIYQAAPQEIQDQFKEFPQNFNLASKDEQLSYYDNVADQVTKGKNIGEAIELTNQTHPIIPDIKEIAQRASQAVRTAQKIQSPYVSTIKAIASKFKASSQAITKYDTPQIIQARNIIKYTPQTSDINTPERQQLRQNVTDKVYGDGAKTKERRLDIVTGGAGSRKSSLIAEPLAKQHGSIITDSDSVKKELPEYGKGVESTSAIHKESAIINKDIILRSLKNGDNIVYPTVGQNEDRLKNIIDLAHKEGYEIHLHHAELNPDVAIPETIKRFTKGEQGFIDPETALNGHLLSNKVNGIVKTYDKLTSQTRYSTEVRKGEKPRVLESSKPGGITNESRGVDRGRAESVSSGSRGSDNISRADGGSKISRKALQERATQLERVNEYKERLKLRGADPVLVDAIITPRGTRAYGASVGGNITLERMVEDFTEDHEIFHQVFQNMGKMRVFKNFDKTELISEAKDLYGDLTESQLEEEMAKDFQQYVNEQENGKSTSFFGKISEFFQRLFASLKRIFQNPSDINEFYRTVYTARASEPTEINNEMPSAFEQQIKDGVVDFRVQNAVANFLDEVPVKDAFTDSGDLTLKTIQKLQGRTTVSKQYIYDLTNSGDIKQVERDLIRSVLDSLPDDQKVDVAQFAQDVKDELLPLEVKQAYPGISSDNPKYETITLPDNLRGNVAQYDEHIYQSPIQTSVGHIHFDNQAPNYFGHTRIEDMYEGPNKSDFKTAEDYNKALADYQKTGDLTRRVIEVQSDLYQKGNLDRELNNISGNTFVKDKNAEGGYRDIAPEKFQSRKQEVAKLQQYNDPTAHFRMVREEIRKAAQDGKTKLQFPTGETAMKIEGLAQSNFWYNVSPENRAVTSPLKIEDLKIGLPVKGHAGDWIITDVLGDGKFKAIPKQVFERAEDSISDTEEYRNAGVDQEDTTPLILNKIKYNSSFQRTIEQFDISGKVDTSNPIYKFYEKDLGRYLKNNYNAVPVTDDKGVTWMEVPIQKAYGDLPVPAFNEHKESQSIEQLQNQRERFKQSLTSYNENPQAHIQAYGEDRSQFYKDKIDQINKRIQDMKNPKFDTDDKLQNAKVALENAQKRVGVAPIETKSQQVAIKKDNKRKAEKFDFTIPEYDDIHNMSLPDLIAAEDALKLNPGRSLMKYVNYRTGLLPAITPDTPGILGHELEKTLLKKGFSSIEEGQEAVDNYIAHTNAFSDMLDDKFNPIELAESNLIKDTPVFQAEKERLQVPGAKLLETMVDQSDKTPLKKKIGILTYLATPKYILEKIGLADEAEFEAKQYRGYLKELPKNIQKITDWSESLPKMIDGKPVTQRIFDYLNGANVDENGFLKPDFLTAKETEVAEEIKKWLEQWADRLHIPQHQRLTNYITHVFEDDFIKKEFDEDLAKIIDGKIPGEVYDPFLQKRLGALGYKRDVWASLDAYAKRATRKVYMDPALEKLKFAATKLDLNTGKYIQRHIAQVNMRPTELETLMDTEIKKWLGAVGLNEYTLTARPVKMITSKLRRIISRATFGLNPTTALKVLTQGVNTYAELGEKNTLLGYGKLFNTSNLHELREEGILNQNIANQDRTMNATRKFWQKTDKVLFSLLTTADNINRGAAYLAGKSKYYSENRIIDRKTGTQIFKEEASEEKARQYARDIAEKTQFMYNSINTPVALGNDIVKTVFQFQSFTTKETEFLNNMRKDKNWSGLLRYVGATLILVYALGKLFKTTWKDVIPVFRFLSWPPPALSVPISLFENIAGTKNQYGQVPSKTTRVKNLKYDATSIIPAGVQISKVLQELDIQKISGQTTQQMIEGYIFGTASSSSTQSQVNTATKKASQTEQTKLDALDPSITQPAQDAWNQVKQLGVGTPEADAVVNNLTDQEYTAYKLVKGADTAYWQSIDQKILPVVQQADQLGFGTDAANNLVNNLSDDEYKEYGQIKTALYGSKDLGTDITGGQPSVSKETFIQRVKAYADAIGTDPVTAFEDIFHGQIIKQLKNGQIIVDRMSYQASQAVKKEEGGNNPSMKLDHAIPLEVGGTNEMYNLQLIPTDEWATNTPVEDYLGKALDDGKITGPQAREYAIRYKAGVGEPLSPKLQSEYKNKYNSEPITLEQIQNLVGN